MAKRGKQLSKKKRRNKAKRPRRKANADWTSLEKRAERELRANAAAIDATPRGTPSGAPSTWKRGQGTAAAGRNLR